MARLGQQALVDAVRLWAAWRNTSVRRITGTGLEAMRSASLGAAFDGTRLNKLYRQDVGHDEIIAALSPLLPATRNGPNFHAA